MVLLIITFIVNYISIYNLHAKVIDEVIDTCVFIFIDSGFLKLTYYN